MPVDKNLPVVAAGWREDSGKLYPTCNARARARHSGYCKLIAGHGTDHKGYGRCKFHRGNHPGLHYNIKAVQPLDIRAMQVEFLKDPEITNVRQDIAMMRAILTKALDIIECGVGLPRPKCDLKKLQSGESTVVSPEDIKYLARWAEIGMNVGGLGSLEKMIAMTSEVTRAIKRLHEIEEGLKLRLDISELPRFIGQVADILARHIDDPNVLKAVGAELGAIAGGVTYPGTQS